MKKTLLFLIPLLLMSSCYSQKDTTVIKDKPVGTAQSTANPHNPYIYKNGYRNYNIITIPVDVKGETIQVHELKFNAVHSSMYTKKVMFDNFGKWTKELRPNNERHPILFWENVKLFDDENKYFHIYANGDENWTEIYASVMVYDAENNDCLSEDNILKEKIIEYFSQKIQKLKDDNKFYDIYWKSVFDHDKKKPKNNL